MVIKGFGNLSRIVAIAFNAVFFVVLIYKAINDPPVNLRGWAWFAFFVGCPFVNLFGLSRITGRLLTFVIAVFNGVVTLWWGGLIALMMVWPLGSKPKGIDLLLLIASWLILVLTEVILLRLSTSKMSDDSEQR